jgi:hypothetical protein
VEAAAKLLGWEDVAGAGRGARRRRQKVESSCEGLRLTRSLCWSLSHVDCAWGPIQHTSAGVPIVDVATVSVAVVSVFELLVWRGGVIRTLACCSWL